MEYWKGVMNAPIDQDWKCQTCNQDAIYLEWGLINGQCRCSCCHTEYMMRDEQNWTTTPICQLKDDYQIPAKMGYEYFHKPINEFTDNDWDTAFQLCLVSVGELNAK